MKSSTKSIPTVVHIPMTCHVAYIISVNWNNNVSRNMPSTGS